MSRINNKIPYRLFVVNVLILYLLWIVIAKERSDCGNLRLCHFDREPALSVVEREVSGEIWLAILRVHTMKK
jgi:hypothetical protein